MPSYVYHYTRARTAIDQILAFRSIRLSRIDRTNDHWERRPQMAATASTPHALDGWPKMARRLHEIVTQAHLGCFSQDAGGAVASGTTSSGWAQDRMWAQYADKHRGVCLWFDREKITQSFQRSFAARGECLADDVTYSDEPNLKAPHLDDGTDDAAIRSYVRRNIQARYFQKRLDWRDEREFRLVLLPPELDAAPVDVPIGGGPLVGVTVGCDFPEVDEPSLSFLCSALEVPISKIVYADRVHLRAGRQELCVIHRFAAWKQISAQAS